MANSEIFSLKYDPKIQIKKIKIFETEKYAFKNELLRKGIPISTST